MNILCIDTSFFTGAVGIMRDNSLIMSISFNVQATYSEKLLYMIDMLCKETEISLNDLDLITVARGPGSFTGLRIGMTAAKTIAYVHSLPIAGVDTLATAVFSTRIPETFYLPLHDARKNQVYAAIYTAHREGLIEQLPSASYEPHDIATITTKIIAQNSCILVTDGSVIAQSVCELLPTYPQITSPFLPDIFALGSLGLMMHSEGKTTDARTLEPLYGRLSDAELQYEKRHSTHS